MAGDRLLGPALGCPEACWGQGPGTPAPCILPRQPPGTVTAPSHGTTRILAAVTTTSTHLASELPASSPSKRASPHSVLTRFKRHKRLALAQHWERRGHARTLRSGPQAQRNPLRSSALRRAEPPTCQSARPPQPGRRRWDPSSRQKTGPPVPNTRLVPEAGGTAPGAHKEVPQRHLTVPDRSKQPPECTARVPRASLTVLHALGPRPPRRRTWGAHRATGPRPPKSQDQAGGRLGLSWLRI